jgi:two-component system catabolic regulation response regulator CreB
VGKPKVLVVEDEPAVADAIAYALATDGCLPLRAETGAGARTILQREDVALVVLDVGLPDVHGLDLCREIRSTRDVPVIFLTARAEEVDRVAGLEIGADDYVTKPFSPRELSARVRAVLRRSRPRETAAPQVTPREPTAPEAIPPQEETRMIGPPATPFTIDESRRVILYFGRALSLTATEYRLLELLARHPGRVYAREELLERLWDDPGATTDRAIDSHVKSLRAKLRAVRAEPEAIETRRGEGYALRERW